jgi:hypothetical protein
VPIYTLAASFDERLREIDMFFAKDSPVHHTMERLVAKLQTAGIPYAIMGGMAVNAHGAQRTTNDLDVLVTPEGLQRFRSEFVGKGYEPVLGRSRRFTDAENSVGVDLLVTGHHPGRGDRPPPFAFPDPTEASVELDGKRVVSLPQLIQLKLAAGRYYDFGDVVFLIRVHNLDESFLDRIHPGVRTDFIECLEEKRREDEYQRREDEAG